jgi:GT2 family glycosyltransferase
MKLSIVIINWNTRDLLQGCLTSIFASTLEMDYEVIVVDNDSSDGSQEMVLEHFPKVKLISNSSNPGFARANNQALKITRGKYILLLNPDTIVKQDAIGKLVEFLEATPGAGGVGARLLNGDGSLQMSAYPEPTLFREFWRMFHFDGIYCYAAYPMDHWGLEGPQEVDILMGACLLIRKVSLDTVGLFDEDYFMYSEEVDLCARLKHAGWPLYWLPSAEVIHYGGQSTQQIAEEMFLQLYRAKILYFRKHRSKLAVLTYKSILFLAALGRLVLTPFSYLERPAQRDNHLILSRNYRRLFWLLPDL